MGAEEFGDRGATNPQRIFEVLARHAVNYVAIGGIAVIAHGHPRNTRDVDIVADVSRANLIKMAAALAELRAELWGVDAALLGIDITDPDTLANGANFSLVTEAGGLDFFNEVPGGAPYDELRARSFEVSVGGVPIHVAGIDDLIAMKRAAGRPRDLSDIAALTEGGI